MSTHRYFGLLFLFVSVLFSFPLCAAEKPQGSDSLSVAQIPMFQESPLAEPGKIPWKQQRAQSQNLQDPKLEAAPRQDAETAPSAIAPYASNPVATKAVDRNISLFAERIKERFSLWLLRSGKYIEMMKEILKGKDIPEDIAFLPLIESGFNPNAYSVARAVGPWQFIASTAKRYGLKIDWWRDERKDPVKSTEAAASYLKDLYDMFGSWSLAMAAYNAGEGKILKALNRSKSDTYWELLNTRYIKDETKEYVPRFIAAKLIATDPDTYGFTGLTYHSPFQFDEVIIDKPLDLDVAAECAETTVGTIRELNPELRRWSTPPNVPFYTLRIPHGKKDKFAENLSSVPEEERFSIATYVVKKGETLKKVSRKTGIPVNVILELNGTKGLRSLNAGERLYLPPKEKFTLDRDDRTMIKKASFKTRAKRASLKTKSTMIKKSFRTKTKRVKIKGAKRGPKKVIVTSLSRKQAYLND
ncbi:MAG: transglycosylase SLT domain-containing protein [Nitrospirae bacterium]|nr:transglycosylase SLT domain-containing protein [Nitrospirota bacterium]